MENVLSEPYPKKPILRFSSTKGILFVFTPSSPNLICFVQKKTIYLENQIFELHYTLHKFVILQFETIDASSNKQKLFLTFK